MFWEKKKPWPSVKIGLNEAPFLRGKLGRCRFDLPANLLEISFRYNNYGHLPAFRYQKKWPGKQSNYLSGEQFYLLGGYNLHMY